MNTKVKSFLENFEPSGISTSTGTDFARNKANVAGLELLIPAQEEEDTESFRERYINSFSTKSFGGNKADYKEKIKGIAGVLLVTKQT